MHQFCVPSAYAQAGLGSQLSRLNAEHQYVLEAYRGDRLNLESSRRECDELKRELSAAREARVKATPSPPAMPGTGVSHASAIRVSYALGLPLERVRAEDMARHGLVSNAPPGLGSVPRAAVPTMPVLALPTQGTSRRPLRFLAARHPLTGLARSVVLLVRRTPPTTLFV